MTLFVLKIFHFVFILAGPIVFVALFLVSLRYVGVSKEIECDHLSN